VAVSSIKGLRYFRYYPPLGGFGGDHDQLQATAPFADRDELERVLAALAYRGPLPLAADTTSLGPLTVDDFEVQVTVINRSPLPTSARRVVLLLAVYVTPEDVKRARRFEAWLDEHGIRMDPRD